MLLRHLQKTLAITLLHCCLSSENNKKKPRAMKKGSTISKSSTKSSAKSSSTPMKSSKVCSTGGPHFKNCPKKVVLGSYLTRRYLLAIMTGRALIRRSELR